MVAQGRASAWGGAPHSCSPSAGGKRPRLVSRALCPWSRRQPQRESRDRRSGSPPLFCPRSVLSSGRRDCTLGVGQRGGSRGPAKICLLVIEFGVCHLSSFTWPNACTPHAPQGRELPGEVGD